MTQTTMRPKAIEKELAKLEERVEKAGWRTERGAPVLAGTLQEVEGVGVLYHRRDLKAESELIQLDNLDLSLKHHVVVKLRALRAELARSRRNEERERRRENREALDAQAEERRAAACRAAGISLEFVDEVKAAAKIIDNPSLWPRRLR